MKFLILAHLGDYTAAEVASRLRCKHLPEEILVAFLEEIVLAPRWSHRIENTRAETLLCLRDGTNIDSNSFGVVFNRLRHVEMRHFAAALSADHEYAIMEMFALMLSWLETIRPQVVSAPSPQSLSGPMYQALTWQYLAGKAGLPTVQLRATNSTRRYSSPGLVPYPIDPATGRFVAQPVTGNVPAWFLQAMNEDMRSAILIGDQIYGDLPAEMKRACLRLGCLSGSEILAIHFASGVENPTRYFFVGADPRPMITQDKPLDALVKLLESRASRFQ